jgi:hypothetical protein
MVSNISSLIIWSKRTTGVLFCLPFLLLLIQASIGHVDDLVGLFLIFAFLLALFVGLPSLLIARGFKKNPAWAVGTVLTLTLNTAVIPLVTGLIFSIIASATIDRTHLYAALIIAGLISLYVLAENIYLSMTIRITTPVRFLIAILLIVIYAYLLMVSIRSTGGLDTVQRVLSQQ